MVAVNVVQGTAFDCPSELRNNRVGLERGLFNRVERCLLCTRINCQKRLGILLWGGCPRAAALVKQLEMRRSMRNDLT